MSEVMAIYNSEGTITITTDGDYYYIYRNGCYERFDSFEDAKDVAISYYA